MCKWLNYLGQLRLYSLLDLWFLLMVVGAAGRPLWGALLLHIGFLAFLEKEHRHKERAPIPTALPWILFMVGIGMFGPVMIGASYVLISVAYALKKRSRCGWISPLVRGAQIFILLVPFTTFHSCFIWVASAAMIARNILGDMRDINQDRQDEMYTWPVTWGQQYDLVFIHLVGVVATTWLWWGFSSVSWFVPIAINLIEVVTYWLTPRPSNKKAVASLRRLAYRLGFS